MISKDLFNYNQTSMTIEYASSSLFYRHFFSLSSRVCSVYEMITTYVKKRFAVVITRKLSFEHWIACMIAIWNSVSTIWSSMLSVSTIFANVVDCIEEKLFSSSNNWKITSRCISISTSSKDERSAIFLIACYDSFISNNLMRILNESIMIF